MVWPSIRDGAGNHSARPGPIAVSILSRQQKAWHHPGVAPADEARQAIQILSLEYQALRADIVHRSSVRFGMLTVGLGIIALFAPLTQANGIMPNWVAVGIILAYLAILSAAWLNAGKSIGILSNQLVVLERRINELAGQPLLSWEMRQQRRRGRLGRRLFGRPLPDQDYGE